MNNELIKHVYKMRFIQMLLPVLIRGGEDDWVLVKKISKRKKR